MDDDAIRAFFNNADQMSGGGRWDTRTEIAFRRDRVLSHQGAVEDEVDAWVREHGRITDYPVRSSMPEVRGKQEVSPPLIYVLPADFI